MECKGCKKDFSESEMKKVGKWMFCATCLDKLLDGASEGHTEDASDGGTGDTLADHLAAPESDDDAPPLVIQGAQASCSVCNCALKEGEGHDMGILTVCDDCYQEMIARPEPIKIQEDEPEEVNPAEEEPEIPWQDPMETIPCACCKRTIKKAGAKWFQDEPYCPDCFYKNNYHLVEDGDGEATE